MTLRQAVPRLLCCLALTGASGGHAQQPPVAPQPPVMEHLGGQRYRVGSIEVDKATATFSVPGKVLRKEPPLEFLVATRGGYKSYESILEADATGVEFNLACILIGLDATGANLDGLGNLPVQTPLSGDPVSIHVSWGSEPQRTRVEATRLLAPGPGVGPVPPVWVYTGGLTLPNGDYLPDEVGTLIGLVRLGESVIEHANGVGVGDYGSFSVNGELLPDVGGNVTIIVSRSPKANASEDSVGGP